MKMLDARKFKVATPKGESTVYSGRCAGGNFYGAVEFDGAHGQVLLIAPNNEVLAEAWLHMFGIEIDPDLVYDASAIGTKVLGLIVPPDHPLAAPDDAGSGT